LHYDHSGLSTLLHRPGCKIYMSEIDGSLMPDCGNARRWQQRYDRCVLDGFTTKETQSLWGTNPAQNRGPEPYKDYIKLPDGALLDYGGLTLNCLLTAGHTPGHMCLYNARNKWLFAGDHVLFHITPNICHWDEVPDSLGDYLQSLRKIQGLDVERIFPAHRAVEGTLAKRVVELQAHHAKRIAEALSIVKEHPGLTPYEIAALMHWSIKAKNWSSFPLTQKYFAVGEARAHLDYLLVRGQVNCRTEQNKHCYYI